MKLLSVAIPSYNSEAYLRKCIESFRGIAKRFVIVDSFSTDATELLCKTKLAFNGNIKNLEVEITRTEVAN